MTTACCPRPDELVNLLSADTDALRLSRQAVTLADFLADRGYQPPHLHRRALVQVHCHHGAVLGYDRERSQLERMGLDVTIPDSGCCGMAGSFGFEPGQRHQVSQACGERVMTYHDLIGTSYLQDVNIDYLMNDIALYNQRIMGPQHVTNVVDYACRTALAQRGPAHVAFPIDYQAAPAGSGTRFRPQRARAHLGRFPEPGPGARARTPGVGRAGPVRQGQGGHPGRRGCSGCDGRRRCARVPRTGAASPCRWSRTCSTSHRLPLAPHTRFPGRIGQAAAKIAGKLQGNGHSSEEQA